MPISRQGGELLYILARAKRPNTIVEFGTSYGISTIYLAAVVADNGTGHVVSTELNTAKALPLAPIWPKPASPITSRFCPATP
jgi:predicted O-methyltransferase YrrM